VAGGVTAFFDRYPRFRSTSYVGSSPNRLNKRHEAVIGSNRALFAGARVLDLASHDGRWSFAALDAGAAHVTGIEARAELVARANETFAAYGVPADRYRFVAGELPDALGRERVPADVVLLLGFLYHTSRHVELLRRIEETGARHVIVDTAVFGDPSGPAAPVVELRREIVDSHANQAAADRAGAPEAIVGYPSRPAVMFLFDYFGFDGREFDWAPLLSDVPEGHDDVIDYRGGARATFRMTRRPPA
jgi:predicted nicotinamide N-methyase